MPKFPVVSNKKTKLVVISILATILISVAISLLVSTQRQKLPKSKSNSTQPSPAQNSNQARSEKNQKPEPNSKTTPQPTPSPTPPTTQPQQDDTLTPPIITASKAGFVPNFQATVENPQNLAQSAVNLEFGSSSGGWLGMGLKIIMPAGWELIPGNQLGENTLVGEGTVETILSGQPSNSKFTVQNLADTQGKKAKWLVKFENPIYKQKFLLVDGDKNSGHTLSLDTPVVLQITSPVVIKFKIFSNTLKNPQNPGPFEWGVEYQFSDGNLQVKKPVIIE